MALFPASDPFLDETICDTLSSLKDNFFSAIQDGTDALAIFHDSWVTFSETINGSTKLRSDTLEMVYSFAIMVNSITSSLLEVEIASEQIRKQFSVDLTKILNENLEKLSIDGGSPEPSQPEESTIVPAYVTPSCAWLLENLHNPYPPKDIRVVIASETNSLCKDIDNWFIDARKRIGWNDLRRRHFSNKRKEIVNAATRFFQGLPQSIRSGPYTHINDIKSIFDVEFIAIQKRAQNLYAGKLNESILAQKSDHIIPDFTVDLVQQEKMRQRQNTASLRKKRTSQLSSYPSPERSPNRSPEPSPTHPLLLPDVASSTSLKRRSSDRDSPEIDIGNEPQKRSRLDFYQDLAVASLPSPAASLCDIAPDQAENDCVILPTPPTPAVPSGKRKRRLSNVGNDGCLKRPCNALAIPRLQTVSDPLPLVVGELYKTINPSIPGPVSVESLDDTQVEVDLYNYNTSPDAIQSFLLANSSLGHCDTTPSLPSSAFLELELPSIDKSQATDDFLFENFLKDLSTAQDPSLFPDIPSHDHSALFPYNNMAPIEPQEEVFSDPLTYFQIPRLPWNFQGNDDIFSAIGPSTGTLFSSNHALPQIDPTRDEKEAKRKQIEALRAQLQNLEAEL